MNTRFPTALIGVATAVTVLGLTACLLFGHGVFRSLVAHGQFVERLYTLHGDILRHDETLTMSALMAAQSGDTRWIERYERIEPQLGQAIEALIALVDDDAVNRAIGATDEANVALVAMETRAFELVEGARPEAALRLLESERYAARKRTYEQGMRSMLTRVEALDREAVSHQGLLVGICTAIGVATLAVLLGIWTVVLLRLRRWQSEFDAQALLRRTAEADVRRLNEELECKVLERTRALTASEARLSHQANVDGLTGLATRRAGMRALGSLLRDAAAGDGRVAVASLDIRSFGSVNELFGHAIGDELLVQVAGRLSSIVDAADGRLARFGGDEFLLACPLGPDEPAETVSARVSAALGKPFLVGERGRHELRVDTRIGLAVRPDHGDDAQELAKKADLARHIARGEGRDGAFTFHAGIERDRMARRRIERGMREALERGQFALHYQPKAHLLTGEPTGAEALLRWTHPELGPVPPDTFIPIAEQTGLILGLGDWVVEEAARQIAAWRRDHGFEMRVAINVSPLQLRHGDFLATLRGSLARHGLAPIELQIELTESSLVENDTHTRELVQGIKDLGCELALDDFGTGYSALSYLKRFPFDYLKIDRSFIGGMLESRHDAAVVRAIIAMAHSLDMRVVSEGIELPEHRDLLTRHGCDLGQGWLFGKPLPADELRELVTGWLPAYRHAA